MSETPIKVPIYVHKTGSASILQQFMTNNYNDLEDEDKLENYFFTAIKKFIGSRDKIYIFGLISFLKSSYAGIDRTSAILNEVLKNSYEINLYSGYGLYYINNNIQYGLVSGKGLKWNPIKGIFTDEVIDISNNDFDFLFKYRNRVINPKIKNLYKYMCWVGDYYTPDTTSFYYYRRELSHIANIIDSAFFDKWDDLLNSVRASYDITKPFDITLTESEGGSGSTTHDRMRNLSDSISVAQDSTEYEDNNSIYAFNSSYPVNTDKAEGSTKRAYSRNENHGGTDKNTYLRTEQKQRNYTRKGNIGNKSQAQLIEEERRKAMFVLKDIIFEDIASVMCGDYYID